MLEPVEEYSDEFISGIPFGEGKVAYNFQINFVPLLEYCDANGIKSAESIRLYSTAREGSEWAFIKGSLAQHYTIQKGVRHPDTIDKIFIWHGDFNGTMPDLYFQVMLQASEKLVLPNFRETIGDLVNGCIDGIAELRNNEWPMNPKIEGINSRWANKALEIYKA